MCCWVLPSRCLEIGDRSPYSLDKPLTCTLVKGSILWGTRGESFLLLQSVFLNQHLLHLHQQVGVQLRKGKNVRLAKVLPKGQACL